MRRYGSLININPLIPLRYLLALHMHKNASKKKYRVKQKKEGPEVKLFSWLLFLRTSRLGMT